MVYLYFDHKLFQLIAGPILVEVASYNHDINLSKSKKKIQDPNDIFKVNKRNTRTRCETCSKLTIKTT